MTGRVKADCGAILVEHSYALNGVRFAPVARGTASGAACCRGRRSAATGAGLSSFRAYSWRSRVGYYRDCDVFERATYLCGSYPARRLCRRVGAARLHRNLGQRRRCGRQREPMRALRVQIVEDEGMIATLLAEVLVGMGYDVCAIEATEADAVAAAARCRPDLIIVDARLREGSGVSAVEQILRTGFVPHVFVSGDTARVRALRPGAVLLRKPFREPELAGAIQRALSAAAAP